jgi:Methyltransferase domain
MKVSDLDVKAAAAASWPMSDMPKEQFFELARVFCEAHERVPDRMTIEVGTRQGGSAVMFASLIQLMYRSHMPPLWTVDPYGGKPYVDGSSHELSLYNDDFYSVARSNLQRFPFHTHWKMTSVEFFERLQGVSYWSDGIRRTAAEAAFILLDGEHAAASVEAELGRIAAYRWLHPQGTIVIDNVDKDPRTLSMLDALGLVWKWDVHGAWAVGGFREGPDVDFVQRVAAK